jgi:DNA-binding response OmpR family regulator
VLIRSIGRPVARDRIANEVYCRQLNPSGRAVDTHISRLRSKLGARIDGEERIKTIWRVGYMYTPVYKR